MKKIKIEIIGAISASMWYAKQIGATMLSSGFGEDGSAFISLVGGGGGYVHKDDFIAVAAEPTESNLTPHELYTKIQHYSALYRAALVSCTADIKQKSKERAVHAAKMHKLSTDPVYRFVGVYGKCVINEEAAAPFPQDVCCAAGTIGCTGTGVETHRYPAFLNGTAHNRCASCMQFIPKITEMCLAGTTGCTGYLIAQREPYGTQFKPMCNGCGKSPNNPLPAKQEKCIAGTTGCTGPKEIPEIPAAWAGKDIVYRCAVCGGAHNIETNKL